LNIIESYSAVDIEIHHSFQQLLPKRSNGFVVELKSTSILILPEKMRQLVSRRNVLIKQLSCKHFIKDVACAEDIAFFVVELLISEVLVYQIYFRSRVKGSAFPKGSLQFSLELLGCPKVSYLQDIILGDEQVVWFEVAMEITCIK
jgi:hypothetical protein